MSERMTATELIERHRCWVAPLAGYTTRPFRMICRSFAPMVGFCEMVKASLYNRQDQKTLGRLTTCEGDRPLGVQFLGGEPEVLGAACARAEADGFDLVCWNAGCPGRKVIRCGEGVATLRRPEIWEDCLRAMREATTLPVVLKTRLGKMPGDEAGLELTRVAQDAGVDVIVMHGRYANEGHCVPARKIPREKLFGDIRIPVIVNGDIFRLPDAHDYYDLGYEGVMLARGVIRRPWLIAEIATDTEMPHSYEARREMALAHLDGLIEQFGEKIAVLRARRQMMPYLTGFERAARYRERFCVVTTREAARTVLGEAFADAAQQEATTGE